jgi:D-alanyl-lipoteichoic acid acyltransferase DltB (MBOAT superfamily)
MVIADNLSLVVDQAYSHPRNFDGVHLAFATLCFAFQIYGDFSAYSDIARGTAALLGVRLMRNFNYPYFSGSVSEFWRRWHISLSSWFRDYLYLPLGGSRVGRVRLVFNIMVTFVVSGLWHGAAWTYVVWGALNGLGIIPSALNRHGAKKSSGNALQGRGLPSVASLAAMVATFSFICLTWVFFRARTLHDAGLIVSRILTGPFVLDGTERFDTFLSPKAALGLIAAFVTVEWICRNRFHPLQLERLPRIGRWAAYTVIIWVALFLRPLHPGNFIYFQF